MTILPCFPTRLSRSFHSLLYATLLLTRLAAGADYLPDAAAHLGTLFINHDDQFTQDPLVTLNISAVDNGSGIVQMQFSNDDQNWSTPETYVTNKQWQLTVTWEDYPPLMNTVLKTVYVRVQYGDGTWSKAFSDGIVFAKSTQDIPLIQEVWVMQQRPSPYDANQPVGSKLNPYLIPAGANQPAFDTLMNTLAKTYGHYRANPGEAQTSPPPMNNVTVMFLHIGPGTYLTHGDNGGRNLIQSWSPTAGGRIKGAGKSATILKMVGGNTNALAHVLGNYGGPGLGVYDNTELSDLTVDANMHEGGNTNGYWVRTGVTLTGNNMQLRRLRVKGFGSRIPGIEPGGMTGYNAGAGNVYNFHIEDCEVIAPQKLNRFNPLMFGYEGGGHDTNGNPYYLINVVVRNNYANGLMYDQDIPINPYTNPFYERGTHGICLGGCKNSLVEDNFVEHTLAGYYNDSFDLNDVLVRNNHFRDVIAGMDFGTGAAESVNYVGNLVELDPHYYTTPASGETAPSDYGWRRGVNLYEVLRAPIHRATIISNHFQFTDRALPDPPLVGGFANDCISGSADFEHNTTFGLKETTIRWYQRLGPPITFYEQQVDILDPNKLPPVITFNNHREDGSTIEVYPYVLDRTLPRPVVAANQTLSFPAPLINGSPTAMVTGLPVTNVIDQNGTFTWTPGTNDLGRYVVSFYDSLTRTNAPRRTLITVQSGLSNQDPQFFAFGLKGYWRLGEDFGNVFLDASGNGNIINLGPTAINYLARGVPGHRAGQKAVHFENGNPLKAAPLSIAAKTQFLGGFSYAYHPWLQRSTTLTRPLTLSYWFQADHQPVNLEVICNLGSLVVCGVGPGPATNNNLAEAVCYYGYSPDLTFYHGIHPQPVYVSIGAWHQQVFVYDGLSTRIYIDGVQRAELPCGQLEDFDVNSLIYLGGGWGGDNYLGSLSDLALWNRPLSADEIARLYVSQQQGPPSSGISPPANLRLTH